MVQRLASQVFDRTVQSSLSVVVVVVSLFPGYKGHRKDYDILICLVLSRKPEL